MKYSLNSYSLCNLSHRYRNDTSYDVPENRVGQFVNSKKTAITANQYVEVSLLLLSCDRCVTREVTNGASIVEYVSAK